MNTDDKKGKYQIKRDNPVDLNGAAMRKFAAMFSATKDIVGCPKIFVDVTEDIEAAMALDELFFWTLPKTKTGRTSLKVYKQGVLWLKVSRSEWWERKRLTERQSDTAIGKLLKLDLIEKEVFSFDGKPQTHLRIKMDKFFELFQKPLEEWIEQEGDEDSIREISDLYAMMGMGSILQNGESQIRELQNGDSESQFGDNDLQNGDFVNSTDSVPTNPFEKSEIYQPAVLSDKGKERLKEKMAGKDIDPAWSILAGQKVEEKQIENNAYRLEALSAFERDMKFNPLPWGSTKKWESLEKHILEWHEKDSQVWFQYKSLKLDKGKYDLLSNRKILDNPEQFVACWPEFLALREIHKDELRQPQAREAVRDEHGIPESY